MECRRSKSTNERPEHPRVRLTVERYKKRCDRARGLLVIQACSSIAHSTMTQSC